MRNPAVTLSLAVSWQGSLSLISRPHPLMKRNGLVNQVKFHGLVHILRQCINRATIKTFSGQPAQERYSYGDETVVREVLRNNY